MPLYEYDCKTRRQSVEILLNRSDETPECSDCGGQQLERLLSVPATPTVRGGSTLPVAAENCGATRGCGGDCQWWRGWGCQRGCGV